MAAKTNCWTVSSAFALLLLIVIELLQSIQAQNAPVISVWEANDHRVAGQKLTLFCKVSNLEGYVYNVKWIKGFTLTDGTRVVFSDGGRVSVSRWTTETGEEIYVLVVADVTRDYGGAFTCQVVYTDDTKKIVSESLFVRISRRNRERILPSCSINGKATNTGHTELATGADVLLMCTAQTTHESATLLWTRLEVYEQSRMVIESDMEFDDTNVRNTLNFKLNNSHSGYIFVCTLSPEGIGDKQDCTIGPIRVTVGVTTPETSNPVSTTSFSAISTTMTDTSSTLVSVEDTNNPLTSNIINYSSPLRTTAPNTNIPTRTIISNTDIPVRTSTTYSVDPVKTDNSRQTTINLTTENRKSTTDMGDLNTFMSLSPLHDTTTENTRLTSESNTFYSSAITTTQLSTFSQSHAKSTFSAMPTNRQTTLLPLSITMTTPQLSTESSTKSPVTKLTTPRVVTGEMIHSTVPSTSSLSISEAETTVEFNTVTSNTQSSTEVIRNMNGHEAGKRSSFNPTIVSVTLLSCIGFVIVLFILVMFASFCIAPNNTTMGKSAISSFHMVNMEKLPRYNSTSSSLSNEDKKSLYPRESKLAEPYHVTNILTNLKKDPDHFHDTSNVVGISYGRRSSDSEAVLYDNRNLNGTDFSRINRRPNTESVLYDNRNPNWICVSKSNNGPKTDKDNVLYDNRVPNAASHQRRPNAEVLYDNRTPNAADVLYDNRNQNVAGISYNKRDDNSDVLYDNRVSTVTDDSYDTTSTSRTSSAESFFDNRSSNSSFFSTHSNDIPELVIQSADFSSDRRGGHSHDVLYDNRGFQRQVVRDKHEPEGEVFYDNGNPNTAFAKVNRHRAPKKNKTKDKSDTASSEGYAEIKPLYISEEVLDCDDIEDGTYNTSAISEAQDNQFHVKRTAIDNPLYNIDT